MFTMCLLLLYAQALHGALPDDHWIAIAGGRFLAFSINTIFKKTIIYWVKNRKNLTSVLMMPNSVCSLLGQRWALKGFFWNCVDISPRWWWRSLSNSLWFYSSSTESAWRSALSCSPSWSLPLWLSSLLSLRLPFLHIGNSFDDFLNRVLIEWVQLSSISSQ